MELWLQNWKLTGLSALQVLRYSALGLGVLYGFFHQRSLTSTQKAAAAQQAYEHKESLIAQAKAEYSKLKNPPAASSSGRKLATDPSKPRVSRPNGAEARMRVLTDLVSQDPMDPKFDLEAYFEALVKEKP